jgi:decaprenylphospho-beta-D-ribofuranose 2-oxidase
MGFQPYGVCAAVTGRLRSLPDARLQRIDGWAMLAHSMGYVYRPSTVEGIRRVLEVARSYGRSVAPRGSGFSYGDTSMNSENIVLDLRRMNRVLAWEPEVGVVTVEPGVTIGQLWRHTLEDGWWPAVVPGTMFPTLGGASSTNVHGKNHYLVGSLGEQILSADLLLPSGEIVTISPGENADIFYAAVGGLGMLGIFVSITMRLEQVRSGLLRVEERACASLDEMFQVFEQAVPYAGDIMGWIDGFGRGSSFGRGLVQIARHVEDDPDALQTLRPEFQDLPDTIGGVLPRSVIWRGIKPLANGMGMRALNYGRYMLGAQRDGRVVTVPLSQFHFVLDYVPNWKLAFSPGGILQYQVFAPCHTARSVFSGLLAGSQEAGLVPYLAVFKRHRPDPFVLNYSVDGYSLALDYHVTSENSARIGAMLERFTRDVVLPGGGRFYPAKDNAVDRESLQRSLTPEAIRQYLDVKRRLDPDGVLQSDLFRRVFG